ncbi:ankyrin repeat-containing domain protein [Baffinella frigidus]|nr:ankyrin repeat-containing domain protein [Cryptophyta sp. CCMP2293]
MEGERCGREDEWKDKDVGEYSSEEKKADEDEEEDEWQEKDVGEYSSEEKKADDDSQKEEEGGAGGGGGCNVKWLKDIKLLTAARHGDLEELEAALVNDADPDGRDQMHELEAALVNGADPDGRDQMHMNWTSLHHAAFYGHADVIEGLIDAGASVIERLIDAGAFVDPRDMANWTPLHHAALKGRTDATLALLRKTKRLHHAALKGRTDATLALLSMGADALALTEFAKTPLQKAVYMCNTETVEAALDLQQQEEEDAASSDDRRGEAQADGFGQEEVHQDDERTASEEVKVQEMKDEYRKQYNQLQEVQGFRKFA